jgi:hypothetical protein
MIPRERRLIVFSDPGGAKPCLALASRWRGEHELEVYSDREYSFYEGFDVVVGQCEVADVAMIVDSFRPTLLYTGTSYTSSIELRFLDIAMRQGVKTAAFVDHYTRFQDRFILETKLVLPDEVHVLDERARRLAISEGIPEAKLKITGNPYHHYLSVWAPRMSREALFWQTNGTHPPDLGILFAPDPLTNLGGREKYGIDEGMAFELLLRAARKVGLNATVFVKPHPNQNVDILTRALATVPLKAPLDVRILPSESDQYLNEFLFHSDLVVGIFSSVLAESELLGTQTLRILCNLSVPDPMNGRLHGPAVSDFEGLCRELSLCKRTGTRKPAATHDC